MYVVHNKLDVNISTVLDVSSKTLSESCKYSNIIQHRQYHCQTSRLCIICPIYVQLFSASLKLLQLDAF